MIRLSLDSIQSPPVAALTDSEFHALVVLWAWVAKWGDDGEFRRKAAAGALANIFGWRRQRCERTLERLIQQGLVEEHEYSDSGEQVLVVREWRSFRPIDLTSAERKRRYRRRKYGNGYDGTEGEVCEIAPLPPHTAEEVEELTRLGQEVIAELEAQWSEAQDR